MKIYPSSMTFAPGGVHHADFYSGCWRWMVATQGVEKKIDPAYQKLGEMWEEKVLESLTTLYPGVTLEREVPFKTTVRGDVVVSGRADIVGPDFIVECKAHFSLSRFKAAPSPEHIAQLVTYMMAFRKRKGLLQVAYFEADDKDEWFQDEMATIPVSIGDDDNTIFVNDAPYKHSIDDLISAYVTFAVIIETEDFPFKPVGSACFTCPARKICGDISDKRLTHRQVMDNIKEVAEKLPITAAKIRKRKKARKG